MLLGSNIYRDLYGGKVGELNLLLNSFRSWSKDKYLTCNKLFDELNKKKYIFKLGRRDEYRITGGIGKSFIYLVPLKQRGHLYDFRGKYVHIICVGHDRYRSMFAFKVVPKKIIANFHLEKKFKILASRTGSGMTSHWKEYLCLTYGDQKTYKIFEGRYNGLAEAREFYDDETEDYVLPEFINGEKVLGIEDNYVVGGELTYYSDEQAIEFHWPGEPNLMNWLKDFQWDLEWEQSVEKMKSDVWNF